MANCPVCQSEITISTQHFGTLFTCPACSAVFFVDWGGQPEVAVSNESFSGNESNNELNSEFPEVMLAEGEPADILNDEEPAVNQFGGDPLNFEAPPYEQEPASHEEAPQEDPANYDFSQPLGDAMFNPEPMANPEPMTNAIADFGNADLGQVAFNYTILISGIDTGAIRSQIQEAITDAKFGWNAGQLMAQIKGGVLTIRSVNPVKASILIQRVKYLPVKISWRQDVLSSTV